VCALEHAAETVTPILGDVTFRAQSVLSPLPTLTDAGSHSHLGSSAPLSWAGVLPDFKMGTGEKKGSLEEAHSGLWRDHPSSSS
jgi:hypothetical protein